MTREEQVQLRMEMLGVSRQEAEFITAIELGEIDSDVIVLDEDGNEVRHPEEQGPEAPPQ